MAGKQSEVARARALGAGLKPALARMSSIYSNVTKQLYLISKCCKLSKQGLGQGELKLFFQIMMMLEYGVLAVFEFK
jgi:hypothetical protein